MFRRQRQAILERDEKLRRYVIDRLAEGWTPEQIAGRLKRGIERDLHSVSFETIYAFIHRAGQKAERLWRYLTRGRPRRRKRTARRARDTIKHKTHISQRPASVDARAEAGHWESDLMICKRLRPLLVLHERKTRMTFAARLMGKTAAETVSTIMAILKRLDPRLRGSITFDNGSEFARHEMLRGMLFATTYFCDAYASWQKGGVENANGRLRRWLTRKTDLDDLSDEDIEQITMTMNLTPRKCLGFSTPMEAFLKELGSNIQISFNDPVALQT